jgi:hypothetical protein
MKRTIASLVVSSSEKGMVGKRTTKHKVLAAVALAAVGLVGTGAVVAVGQGKELADSGQPAADRAPSGMPDDLAPTAFPDIKPLNSEDVAKFFAARLHLVRASADDAPTVGLNNAKLRLAVQTLHYNFELSSSNRFDDWVLLDMSRAVRNIADTAAALWQAADDRRSFSRLIVAQQA